MTKPFDLTALDDWDGKGLHASPIVDPEARTVTLWELSDGWPMSVYTKESP